MRGGGAQRGGLSLGTCVGEGKQVGTRKGGRGGVAGWGGGWREGFSLGASVSSFPRGRAFQQRQAGVDGGGGTVSMVVCSVQGQQEWDVCSLSGMVTLVTSACGALDWCICWGLRLTGCCCVWVSGVVSQQLASLRDKGLIRRLQPAICSVLGCEPCSNGHTVSHVGVLCLQPSVPVCGSLLCAAAGD